MSVTYKCRHCSQYIGQLDQEFLSELQPRLDEFSSHEREEVLQYEDNGDINIFISCKDCEKALKNYPQYHELDFFIQ